jgi:hypothetical protein
MVDDIKSVLALMTSLLLATCQIHKYPGPFETLTSKGRHFFVDAGLLVFESQTINNAVGYPVPFCVGIPCRQYRQWLNALPRAV